VGGVWLPTLAKPLLWSQRLQLLSDGLHPRKQEGTSILKRTDLSLDLTDLKGQAQHMPLKRMRDLFLVVDPNSLT
jgi:hypothetical protein